MSKIKLYDFELKVDNPVAHSEIKGWWQPFAEELDCYAQRSLDGEPWRLYRESALLGFLAGSIIRSDKTFSKSILQEFCLSKEGNHFGRCDLLLIVETSGKKHAYLIEAKSVKSPRYGIKEWSDEEYVKLIKNVEDQAISYYEADVSAYTHYETVNVISLVYYYAQYNAENLQPYIERKKRGLENSFYGLIASEQFYDEKYKNESCLEFFGSVKTINP